MPLNGLRVKDITPPPQNENILCAREEILCMRNMRAAENSLRFWKISPWRDEVEASCTFPSETALDVAHELPEQTRHLNELPEQEEI